MLTASLSLGIVLLMMLGELAVSRRNERALREAGAIEPPDDVIETMRWAYPAAFAVMAIEGAVTGPPPPTVIAAGAAVLIAAKGLKAWAILTLGERWSFRVLVLPGAPLVKSGPYALMRHPNYIAVAGELVGMAVLVGARFSGPVATFLFTLLLRARTKVENRALGYPPCS